MVNDQLILDIQAGDRSKIPELWCSVKKFAYMMSNKFYLKFKDICDAQCYDADDLAQSGYFAMLDALKSYKVEAGSNFISWYAKYLTKQFEHELHYHYNEPNLQTNFNASMCSLNDEISSDSDADELLDVVPDGHDYIAEIDDKLEAEELHKMLDDFINDFLEDLDKEIIRKDFWDNKPKEKIAEECNIAEKKIYAREHRALHRMLGNLLYDHKGNPMSRQRLLNYLEQTDPSIHMSRDELIRNHTSIPEEIVLRKEAFGML